MLDLNWSSEPIEYPFLTPPCLLTALIAEIASNWAVPKPETQDAWQTALTHTDLGSVFGCLSFLIRKKAVENS